MQMASSSLLPLFVLVLVLLFSISSAYSSKSSFLDGINQNPIKMIKVADEVSGDLNLNGMEVKNNQQSGNGSYVIVGPWGRRGLFHTSFDDGAHKGITEIGLDYVMGVVIVGINITYVDGTIFNHTGWFPSNESAKIPLDTQDGEFISEVNGTTADLGRLLGGRIRSLTFKTNTNKTFGPYGNISGTPFNLPIEHGLIVGFKGSVGIALSSLGIYLSP